MGLVQGSFKHKTLIRETVQISTRAHKLITVSLAKVLVLHKTHFFVHLSSLSWCFKWDDLQHWRYFVDEASLLPRSDLVGSVPYDNMIHVVGRGSSLHADDQLHTHACIHTHTHTQNTKHMHTHKHTQITHSTNRHCGMVAHCYFTATLPLVLHNSWKWQLYLPRRGMAS